VVGGAPIRLLSTAISPVFKTPRRSRQEPAVPRHGRGRAHSLRSRRTPREATRAPCDQCRLGPAVLRNHGAHSDVVCGVQELVELALKRMLRAVGVESPKVHDVGPLLAEHSSLSSSPTCGAGSLGRPRSRRDCAGSDSWRSTATWTSSRPSRTRMPTRTRPTTMPRGSSGWPLGSSIAPSRERDPVARNYSVVGSTCHAAKLRPVAPLTVVTSAPTMCGPGPRPSGLNAGSR
jgi:hypothetical protein